MLMCNFVLRDICLSIISHDAVQILAAPEPIAGGVLNCKTGEFHTPPWQIYLTTLPHGGNINPKWICGSRYFI